MKVRIALTIVAVVVVIVGIGSVVGVLMSTGPTNNAPAGSNEQGTPAGVVAKARERIPFAVNITPVSINIEANDADAALLSDAIALTITDDGVHDIALSLVNLEQLKDNFKHLLLWFTVKAAPKLTVGNVTIKSVPDDGQVLMVLTFDKPEDTTRVFSAKEDGDWEFEVEAFWKAKEEVDDLVPIAIKVNVTPA